MISREIMRAGLEVCARVHILFLGVEKFDGLHSQFTPPSVLKAGVFKVF